jgi:hypothetical protein
MYRNMGYNARRTGWSRRRTLATPLVLLLAASVACSGRPATPAAGQPAAQAASPAHAARAPQMHHLAAAITLEAVIGRPRLPPPTAHARCPAGFAPLSGTGADPALCYHQLGRPMTITYAAISLIEPPSYGVAVSLRAGDRAALTSITTRAAGHQIAVIVAGKAWLIAEMQDGPITSGQFQIFVPTMQKADDLLRILD